MNIHLRDPQYVLGARAESVDTLLAIAGGLFSVDVMFFSSSLPPAALTALPPSSWAVWSVITVLVTVGRILWPTNPGIIAITATRFLQCVFWCALALAYYHSSNAYSATVFVLAFAGGSCWSLTRSD